MSKSKRESMKKMQKEYDELQKVAHQALDAMNNDTRRAVDTVHNTEMETYAQHQCILFITWLVRNEVKYELDQLHEYYIQFRKAQFKIMQEEISDVTEAHKKLNKTKLKVLK